jgi:predicted HTH domain antitoxin
MSLMISDDVLRSTRMSEPEMRQEIAVMLYGREKLTLEQAADLAGMPQINFRQLLASRDVLIHYDIEDFEGDLRTLRELGRL